MEESDRKRRRRGRRRKRKLKQLMIGLALLFVALVIFGGFFVSCGYFAYSEWGSSLFGDEELIQ